MASRIGNIHLSVVAGIFATIGSLFGKLAGGVTVETTVLVLIKLILIVLMVTSNTAGCVFFVKSFQGSASSLPATVASAATNYFCSVLPGLYVGNYRDSKDSAQLERYEITHILAIHDAARRLHSDKHYLCILAADTPDQNLTQYFPLCNDFIHAARLRGGNVLIHCLAGMSRSVTVAVAYITSTTDLSWKEALKVVRVGRAVANPNVGFQQQLQDFEATRLQEERRRLKERFPSLALATSDAEICRAALCNYESLALAREVCEGKCAMGRTCPTGLCRQPSKRTLRRKSSTTSTTSLTSGRTPPHSPRMLPSAPPSPSFPRSASTVSSGLRPRSGPAGLHSYTGSAPPSRAVSRVDLSSAVACSSSNTNLSTIGRTGTLQLQQQSNSNVGNKLRLRAGSAPATPRATPPGSPQHWPRSNSGYQSTIQQTRHPGTVSSQLSSQATLHNTTEGRNTVT